MGYSVQLIKGGVGIPTAVQDDALRAVRELDLRDDLKGGWSRVELPDGTLAGHPHWAFVDPDELGAAVTLVEALRAFRFEAVTSPDGQIEGVELIGNVRSAGDERHLWAVLAPFVQAGGEMIWFGEDDRIWRWSFDGTRMHETEGRLSFR